MAMAALRHRARRLACQRPPAICRAAVAEERPRLLPRHIHGGSSAAGRTSSPAEEQRRLFFHGGSSAAGSTFSLAEEQRRLFFHGGSTALGRTYSRQFCSFQHGEPNPITFKRIVKLCFEVVGLVCGISTLLLEVIFFGLAIKLLIKDLSGPRYVPQILRILFGPIEDVEEMLESARRAEMVRPRPNEDE